MKAILHKIFCSAMAFLLLASTVSWKVEKHYCMGHLMDTALFTEASSCGMDVAMMDMGESKKSCCTDEIIIIEGQEDLQFSLNDISLEQQQFLVAFTFSYSGLFQLETEQSVPEDTYPPPILVKDIQLLDQVFLI
ncbi:HYC_CC_PP family protein [Maribacter sp. 2210JD10-5]|uniref:HYC_CC_PP family protein n=1 Tax=Maribacter sp. 2210JD10-5 TaxID=3386272 RepID=UPI0039BCF0E2